MQGNSVSTLFAKYQDQSVIKKCKDFAGYTIPSLMADPTTNHSHAEKLEYDYQSVGALLVNNLTAKLAMALFPTGRNSFKIDLAEDLEEVLRTSMQADTLSIKASLAELERLATEQVYKNAALSKLYKAIKLLIVTGNVLIYRDSALQTFYMWNVYSFVVRRDMAGRVTQGILKQVIPYAELNEEIQREVIQQRPATAPDTIITQYTDIQYRNTGSGSRIVHIQHYIDDKPVGKPSTYPEHLSPYIFPAWDVPSGEHYGRGYVEDYAADFARLSMLAHDVSLYEGEILHLLNLVDEAGGSAVDEVIDKPTGAYVPGRAESITAYEKGSYQKLETAYRGLDGVVNRLNQAFMYTGQMRQAERVTAEEVRSVATEAENLLGGAYSVLAENLQAPLAYLSMYEVAQEHRDILGGLIANKYRPVIITGIPALTAATETQNLLRASQEIGQILPIIMQAVSYLDPNKVSEVILLNNGVDVDSLRKSAEQLQQEAEAEQAMAEAEQAAAQADAEANIEESDMLGEM